jgi:hypothetical protein
MWLEELLKLEGVSERDARGRLETMRRNNPDAYGKELGRRAGRAKRDLLRRGDVDFEVPTPAVVKEGDLAPYRDLVYFTKPTQREMDYLNNVQRAFEAEISRFTRSEALQDWTARSVLGEEKDGKRLEEDLRAVPLRTDRGPWRGTDSR